MRIETVRLSNVRRHEEFEAEFGPGVVLLLGQNGAGKSSVLMAISYALFGELPVKAADFVRTGAKSASVEVSFVAGQRYTVYRSTDGQYRLSCGQKVLSSGKADTETALKMLLGLRPDVSLSALCKSALSVPQGELTVGFDLSDKARFEHWSRLLRLDEWRRAWEALRPAARLLESRRVGAEAKVSALESSLPTDELPGGSCAEIESRIAELHAEKERLSVSCESLRAEVTQAAVALAARGMNEEQLEKVETSLSSVRAELERKAVSLDGELEKLRRELAESRFDPALSEEVRRSAEKLAADWAEVHRIAAERRRVKETLGVEAGKLEEAEAAEEDVSRLKELLLERREAQVEAAKVVVLSKGEIERARLGQRDTREGEPCPICGAVLSEQRVVELRAEFASAIERAGAELERAEREGVYSKREIVSLQAALEKAQAKIALAAPDLVYELTGEFEQLTRELRVAESAVVVFGEAHDVLEQAEKVNRIAAERNSELRASIARLEAQESARQDDVIRLEAGLRRLEDEATDLSISLAIPLPESREGELEDVVISLAHVEEELYACRQELASWKAAEKLSFWLAEAKSSVSVAESLSRRLSVYRGVMDAAGPLLAEQVMRRLSVLANEKWQAAGKDGVLVWGGDFALSVDGRAFGMLSGGEQVVSALACRLAVAHWMAGLDWLVLDEPTVHLDEQARLGLAEAIGRSGLEQVFVVTHDDTFASVAGQVVRL